VSEKYRIAQLETILLGSRKLRDKKNGKSDKCALKNLRFGCDFLVK